jgi:peptide methionine sulfoxide reductase MsrA
MDVRSTIPPMSNERETAILDGGCFWCAIYAARLK